MSQPFWLGAFEQNGFHIEPDILNAIEIAEFLEELGVKRDCPGVRQKEDAIYAIRNLLEYEAVRDLVRHPAISGLVAPILGPRAFAVRGILFDKNQLANWKVTYHQDATISVNEMREMQGYGPWSIKSGVVHVQPPAEVLGRMLTVRLHLDECGPENGPLRVLPGSHRQGRLTTQAIQQARENMQEVPCLVGKGGAVIMRPLLLHASSAAQVPQRRRVIHLEFAAEDLPQGLEWERRVEIAPPLVTV